MSLADAAWAQEDHVLATVDVIAACEIQHQHLVERGDGFEVEALELFDDREACLLDAPLDQPALAVDQLQLHQTGQELDMIQALGRALLRHFLVFPLKGGQLQSLQVMLEQDAGRLSHGWRPAGWRSRRCWWRRRRAGANAGSVTGRDAPAASRCGPAAGA